MSKKVRRQEYRDCPDGTLWYTCAEGNYRGCCASDPCRNKGICPIDDEAKTTSDSPSVVIITASSRSSSTTSSSRRSTATPSPISPSTSSDPETTVTSGTLTSTYISSETSQSSIPAAATNSSSPSSAVGEPVADNGGLIGGAVGGVLGVIAIVVVLVLIWLHRRRKRRTGESSASPLLGWFDKRRGADAKPHPEEGKPEVEVAHAHEYDARKSVLAPSELSALSEQSTLVASPGKYGISPSIGTTCSPSPNLSKQRWSNMGTPPPIYEGLELPNNVFELPASMPGIETSISELPGAVSTSQNIHHGFRYSPPSAVPVLEPTRLDPDASEKILMPPEGLVSASNNPAPHGQLGQRPQRRSHVMSFMEFESNQPPGSGPAV
ncbi:hypothetical protein FQN57_005510 [Myotisia sp. PD_48]|nr:hypothetical protein FQN57_005510 [Myotisia sp. PD_48]